MAEAKVTTYTSLEDAKVACATENAEVARKGEGKERFVFAITAEGNHKFYVIATISGKAVAAGARALGIKANVAEKKSPTPQKSVTEQISVMGTDEREKLKALIAQLEAQEKGAVPEVNPTVVDTETPKKKGKKYE